MKMSWTRAVIAFACALAVAAPAPAHAGLRDGGPLWSSCPAGTGVDPRQECTTVSVPVDYAAPGGPRIWLAVSRIRTAVTRLRRGVLVLIPGGPGNSGLNRPGAYAGKLPKEVLDRYDIVGFDPRGVGASAPISCRLSTDDIASSHLKPWPAAGGDISANVQRARRMAAGCLADGGPLLTQISTRNEARDLDVIRAALGERKLSYWGVSYGTYVGAVYATLYPRRTDRVVLDSNDDPDPTRVERGWLANYATGVEDRFPDFAAWYSPADPARVRPAFLALAARLDKQPLPWPGANPPVLDGNVLRDTMLNDLYSDASFPQLGALIDAALAGGPLPAASTPPEELVQNTSAVALATLCGDVAWPRSIAGYAREVTVSRAAHPLTAGMPVNVTPCAFWPAPAEQPVRVGDRGPANILLIQNKRDPATPLSGAERLAAALGRRATMVVADAGGHGSYLANGTPAGNAAVTAFLAYGDSAPPGE
jgi:pimeloyl-ACP methyl ester carboxylesterase